MTNANETKAQAKRMAELMAQYSAEYRVGQRVEMEWAEEGRRYRGAVTITAEHLRAADVLLAELRKA